MATVSVDLWFPDVVPAAQLCPNPIIRREIINTCRDFCERTMLWTSALDPIDVVADTPAYPLPIGSITDAEIAGADRAAFNGKTIWPTSETALDEDNTQEKPDEWRSKTVTIPERYFITFDKNIRLVYTPDAALVGGLEVWAFLIPLIDSIVVQDFLWVNFKDMITEGTKGRLKAILDMPWTDMQAASTFINSYEFQINKAMQKKHKGFQRTKTRSFVRTRYHDF